jgi:translation initiation factor 2-alpha kinase 3
MPQKYWVSSEDLSADSSIDSSLESVHEKKLDNGKGVNESQKSTESIGRSGNDEAVVPAMATSMSLANLQPQQHATLFYLSLIEGRCRTQAASRINSRLHPQDHLPEDHPEICDLAQHLFNEMKKELLKAGMIPEEFAGHSLPDLRRYLNSFDSLLNNIAAKQDQNISIPTDNFRVINGSPFLLSGESSPFAENSKALIRHIPRVADEIKMAYPEADPRILALLYSKDQMGTDSKSVYKSQYNEYV